MKRPEPKPPKAVAPTLKEACVRIAGFLAHFPEWTGYDYSDERVPAKYRADVGLMRSDLVALLAAVGWVEPLETAVEPVQEPLL